MLLNTHIHKDPQHDMHMHMHTCAIQYAKAGHPVRPHVARTFIYPPRYTQCTKTPRGLRLCVSRFTREKYNSIINVLAVLALTRPHGTVQHTYKDGAPQPPSKRITVLRQAALPGVSSSTERRLYRAIQWLVLLHRRFQLCI